MIRNVIFIFIFSCFEGLTQNSNKYFYDNIYYFNKQSNEKMLNKFLNHDYYFLGEKHETSKIDSIRFVLIDLLIKRKTIDFIFLEEGVNSYLDFENFSNYPKSKRCCQEFIWDMSYYKMVLNGINKFNLSNKKISVIPIDVFHSLYQYRGYDITRIIKSKNEYNQVVYRDVKKLNSLSKKNREKYFKQFVDSFEIHKRIYYNYLGKDYKKVQKIVDAFNINYNTIRTNPDNIVNESRENFMFQNILSEIDSSKVFISLNGAAHISLESLDGPVSQIKGWESLAYKFFINYPNKNVCSIYIMNRNEDNIAEYYFKDEKNKILEIIPDGDIALIDLRADNSPFCKMGQMFSYVFVY